MKLFQNILHANSNQRRARVAIPISDKIYVKFETSTRYKEGHYKDKGLIHQEDKTIINIYAYKSRVPKCIKQTFTELKGEID